MSKAHGQRWLATRLILPSFSVVPTHVHFPHSSQAKAVAKSHPPPFTDCSHTNGEPAARDAKIQASVWPGLVVNPATTRRFSRS